VKGRFVEALQPQGYTFTPVAHPNGGVILEAEKAEKAAYVIASPAGRFAYVLHIGNAVHRGSDVSAASMREVISLLF